MLALERKATMIEAEAKQEVRVKAQPFGGAVRLRDRSPLVKLVGDFSFDSQRSQDEGDFRILIQPEQWPAVRDFCLRHLDHSDDPVLETTPERELVEEFYDALGIRLTPDQYSVQAVGMLIESHPARSENIHAAGYPTARIYRVFEVRIQNIAIAQTIIESSARYSDEDLRRLVMQNAIHGRPGRANATLALPLRWLTNRYLALPEQNRNTAVKIAGHLLDGNVPAILKGVPVPKYQRISSQ